MNSFYDLMPLKCSRCGSTNAVKPLNDRDVAVRCGDCGHVKLTAEAQARENEKWAKEMGLETNGWSAEPRENTF